MRKQAAVTIVSNNYLHLARTLMRSVAVHHPEVKRFCVLVDRDPSYGQALQAAGEFELITLSQLGLPDGDDFLFQYTVLELNTAVKPWALQHLLRQGFEQAVYLDPDIRLYAPLREVFDLLDDSADVVLTPHLTAPMTDDAQPDELAIRRAGTYNLGFAAVADTVNVHRYLAWWQGKLRRHCVVEVERGIFVDQSWMDLVPALFDRVAVLRHAGYNVAYWNLAQRRLVQAADGSVRVVTPLAPRSAAASRASATSSATHQTSSPLEEEGVPLVFFHYSGFNARRPQSVSKHQNRLSFDQLNDTERGLMQDYARALLDAGADLYGPLPYGFAHYRDGTPVEDGERARFRQDDALRQRCGGRPFDCAELLSGRRALAQLLGGSGSTAQGAPHSAKDGKFLDELAASVSASSSTVDEALQRALTTLNATGVRRVQLLYRALLGREAEPMALLQRVPRVATPWGAVRTVLAVGLSAEARRRPGWVDRLLGFVDEAPMTPARVRRWLAAPARRLWRTRRPGALQGRGTVAPALREGPAADIPSAAVPSAAASPALGLNLVGYPRAELGVGEALRSMARACQAVDLPFALVDVGEQTPNRQNDDSIIELAQPGPYAVDMLYVNADQAARTAQTLSSRGYPRARLRLGFWHWEQPALPARLHAAFAQVDEVWVPSRFVHDAVAPVAPVPVFMVPHAVAPRPTPGLTRARVGLPDDGLRVLVMYDFHSYQERKNPRAAIEAFRLASARHPRMTLVVKTINGASHPQALADLRDWLSDLPRVHVIDDFLSRQQTWDLQAQCDVLLSLHRAEGFGLAPAEMMALGKAVVATGWSANMDFMTTENSMPVRFELKPLARDMGAYPAGPLWAEADVAHAAWCLEQLAADESLGQRLGVRAAADIAAMMSPEVVGRTIRARLELLTRWHLGHGVSA